MIKEHAPRVETDAEAVHPGLFERVLAEEAQELENGKVRVVFDSLEVRGDKPVEKVAALGQESVVSAMDILKVWYTTLNT